MLSGDIIWGQPETCHLCFSQISDTFNHDDIFQYNVSSVTIIMLSSRSDTVFGIQLFSDCVFPCSYTYAPLCESIWRKTTSQPSWVQGASSYCLGATGFQCCFPVVCTESWKDPEWIQLKKTTRERYWILTSVLDLLAKSRSFGASSSWEAADRKFGCLVKSGNRKRVKERFQKIQTKN